MGNVWGTIRGALQMFVTTIDARLLKDGGPSNLKSCPQARTRAHTLSVTQVMG